jgi:hypothetical protein
VLYIVFFIIIKLEFLCFAIPRDPSSDVKGDPFLLPPLLNILNIIAGSTLSKYIPNSLQCRVYMRFVSKEDITPKILHWLVNMLKSILDALTVILC